MLALRFELWDSKMRRGVQEYIKNWVGRPLPEYRPNFRFVCPTIQLGVLHNKGTYRITLWRPSQIWALSSPAEFRFSYSYSNDLFRYWELHNHAGPCVIEMSGGIVNYKAGQRHGFQRCGIKRPYMISYILSLDGQELSVEVSGKQNRTKLYKVSPKNVEEGSQLFRKIIRQLDQHVGI